MTWISREEGSATRELLESTRWEMALNIRRRLALPSWEAIKLAVAQGAGIAAISRFALNLELRTGSIVVLDVPRWHVRRQLSVVRARDVPLTPAADHFLQLLRPGKPGRRLNAPDAAAASAPAAKRAQVPSRSSSTDSTASHRVEMTGGRST